ncbi:hypothetical protein HMPREF9093_01173 [Fusobacterium sp. oral taxon 370 str. F0437]|uniref:restriction endonuclease n=1 Tax=Fusobacterium sp. oral taxon 370 TaxID=712288 RepID=UPI000234AD7E|nr:restriction endonuclease [Fusobacterium sp. oral taxon 370]EHI78578.1 hypothetical protein HMPREF9093_01173 [Fusobacterium sp. oral taxon 370 str. F0437]
MKISDNLSENEIKSLLEDFYQYFETGYIFEDFLREYLLKMGLDEVEVTQRSRDGGIDLKAIRKGIGDFSEIDTIHYYIQAKKYTPDKTIGVKTIRELKGTIPFGYKGMLITTAHFTDDAYKEALNDPSKPAVLIDGKLLITSCIDNEIGFIFKPIFSKIEMDSILNKNDNKFNKSKIEYIEKTITKNDIRARIISIPSSIKKELSSLNSIDVIVNDNDHYHLTIDKSHSYLAKVTKIFKKYGMLTEDKIGISKKSKWFYDMKNKTIYLIIGD